MQDNHIVHYQHKFVEGRNTKLFWGVGGGGGVGGGVEGAVVQLLLENTCIRFLGNHCCIDKHANHMWHTYCTVCYILPL